MTRAAEYPAPVTAPLTLADVIALAEALGLDSIAELQAAPRVSTKSTEGASK